MVTHFNRFWVKKSDVFQKSQSKIWGLGILYAALTALQITVLVFIPGFWLNEGDSPSAINIFSYWMNWFRYTIVWTIIYFMFQILQFQNLLNQQKLETQERYNFLELELLKSKINPHFLFNALNSIKSLIRINPDQAQEAMLELSELLRYTLNYERSQWVSLKTEWEMCLRYLQIEKIRFGDRLNILTYVETDLSNHKLPPILLITLVENAVKHGITKEEGPGYVRLKASSNDGFLKLEVHNNGSISNHFNIQKEGIGITFIQKRLFAIYGTNAQFALQNLNQNIIAELTLPYES